MSVLRDLGRARRVMYRGARVAGDVNAVARGPEAIAKRVARKAIWRAVGKLVRF